MSRTSNITRIALPLLGVGVVVGVFLFRAGPSTNDPGLTAGLSPVPPKSVPSPAAQPVSSTAPTRPPVASAPAAYDREAMDRLLAEALSNDRAEERRLLLRGIAEFLAKNDPDKAQEYLKVILRGTGNTIDSNAFVFVQMFADQLASRDPRQAAAWAKDIPDSLKEVTYQFVARHWAASDPRAAAEWLPSVPDAGMRATIIRALAQQLSASDPTGFAGEWAASLARSRDGARFSDVLIRPWAKSDANAAWEWVKTLENPDDHSRALIALTGVVAEQDPAKAIAWVEGFPAGETKNRATQETVAAWANRDPAAAAAWVDARASNPGLVQGSVHAIATAWMRQDAAAASQWLERAPVSRETKNYILALTAKPSGRP